MTEKWTIGGHIDATLLELADRPGGWSLRLGPFWLLFYWRETHHRLQKLVQNGDLQAFRIDRRRVYFTAKSAAWPKEIKAEQVWDV